MNESARAQRGETGGRCGILTPHGISVNLDRRGGIERLNADVGAALGALTTCGCCWAVSWMPHTRTVVDGYCQVRGLKMAGREAFLRLELGLGK